MQRSPSISRFSMESAEDPIAPSKSLSKLGKLLGLKAGPSTPNDRNHTTDASERTSTTTHGYLAVESATLSYSASFRSRRKDSSTNAIVVRSLGHSSRPRSLHHSISAPVMHTSILRPNRRPTLSGHKSSASPSPLQFAPY